MTNHIGTTKIETASGTREVPVFDPADMDEPGWYRVQTPAGTGAIRLVDVADATLDEYRVQTPGGLKAVATSLDDIPDSGSLHARYDATELSLSDQDSVTTWSDETGNGHDLTAGTAPTYRTGIIDGNPVVRFDGADDFLGVAFSALSQPNHIFLVYQLRSIGSAQSVYDGESSRHKFGESSSGNWDAYAGSAISGSATDTNAHVGAVLFNGSNSAGRIDGSQDMSGDIGSESLDGFRVGRQSSAAGSASHATVDVGEILVYPEDKSGIQSDVESYLADKWGITI